MHQQRRGHQGRGRDGRRAEAFARQSVELQRSLAPELQAQWTVLRSATGLVATIQVGSRVVVEESPLAILTTMPKLQDDFYYSEGVLANERVICRVRNTTGGPLTVRAIAQMQPV